MKRLLLISNSTSYGSGYLDHCEDDILSFLGREVKEVTFIPYANPNRKGYVFKAKARFEKMGLGLRSIFDDPDPAQLVKRSEAIFIGGGNTFLLLKALYDEGLIEAIRNKVEEGTPYIGTSAGSNVACRSIKTTNDMPIVHPPSFNALNLVPFVLNPHYIDPDPLSTHKGETRKKRINEFHQLNEEPVVGLRESAMLLIEGRNMVLKGPTGAKLFRKGMEPEGSPLDRTCHSCSMVKYIQYSHLSRNMVEVK
jgi:dipeptidase E